VAATSLLAPLLVMSLALLGYAHYEVWVRRSGHRTGTRILLINTVLVAALWAWRLAC